MGWNLPDGCCWPSDIDYYESLNAVDLSDREDDELEPEDEDLDEAR